MAEAELLDMKIAYRNAVTALHETRLETDILGCRNQILIHILMESKNNFLALSAF